MRIAGIALLVGGSAVAGLANAQAGQGSSIHLAPLGTAARGFVQLESKRVPLPDGEFVLAAVATNSNTFGSGDYASERVAMVEVILLQAQGTKVKMLVAVRTPLASSRPSSSWVDEPCKRADTLLALDLAKRINQQNCLLVNHVVNTMNSAATGAYAEAIAYMTKLGVETPVPLVITATVTRIEIGEFVAASYAFNPDLFGCSASFSPTWIASPWHKKVIEGDKQKAAFVKGIADWGRQAQLDIDEMIMKRKPRVAGTNGMGASSAIQRCSS